MTTHPFREPTFLFIGVTTGQSAMNAIFPLWMERLGRPEVQLVGVDHPIHDAPAAYHRTVQRIQQDPLCLGGLVTTHKMDLFASARDLFAFLDPYAESTHELSSISKRPEGLAGHATDPVAVGLCMDALLGEGYFGRTGAEVLCLGAGGSGVATLLHLINKERPADRPRRFVVVNRSQARLDHMAEMAAQFATDIEVDYILNSDPAVNDTLMGAMAEGSLVINATGMGKDTPGSPITDDGLFPQGGIAWDYNYRGELDFLRQARLQAHARNLRVEDGWDYFVYGWAMVLSHVLHREITPALFADLSSLARQAR